MKVGLVAGEASGDLLGAKLIQALKTRYPDLQVEGVAGPRMIAEGCRALYSIERLSVMGLIEPLRRLPDLFKLRRDLYRHFTQTKPDLFIGVDAPDFNLGLAHQLKGAGIPTVHYVSPSVWAWRRYRIHKIAKAVDLMLTLLPFEAKFYQQHHVPVRYVGHPLAEQIPMQSDELQARKALDLDADKTYVALLPGSRRQEIRYMAEPYLRAAERIQAAKPNVEFLVSHVSDQRAAEFNAIVQRISAQGLKLHVFNQASQTVMAAADVVVVTSGTATLETMLYKKPMVIAYRMPWLTYQIAKRIVTTPYIGLPNLLANETLVPELIQEAVTPAAIADHVLAYLNSLEKCQQLRQRFIELHQRLQGDSPEELAKCVFSLVE